MKAGLRAVFFLVGAAFTLGWSFSGTACLSRAGSVTESKPISEVAMSSQVPPFPSFDRKAPPSVPPVIRDGVRYQQNLRASEAEFGQVGGILTAYDAKTGAALWSVKVYENQRKPGLEGDVQDVFFRSMAFDEAGRLIVENERGARFAVDIIFRSVAPLP